MFPRQVARTVVVRDCPVHVIVAHQRLARELKVAPQGAAVDQVGVPGAQLDANYFPGPHGVYAGEVNLKRFNGAVRAFVKAGPNP